MPSLGRAIRTGSCWEWRRADRHAVHARPVWTAFPVTGFPVCYQLDERAGTAWRMSRLRTRRRSQ
jgi:hypothetical protein